MTDTENAVVEPEDHAMPANLSDLDIRAIVRMINKDPVTREVLDRLAQWPDEEA